MKPKDENKIDKLFKDGLTGPEDHIAFRDEDWTAMERMLDNKPSKKAVVFRIVSIVSGIAALLLIALALFFFNGKDKSNKGDNIAKNKITIDKKSTGSDSLTGANSPSDNGLKTAAGKEFKDNEAIKGKTFSPVLKDGVANGQQPKHNYANNLKSASPYDQKGNSQRTYHPEVITNNGAGQNQLASSGKTALDSNAAYSQLAAVEPEVSIASPATSQPQEMSDVIKAKFPQLPKKAVSKVTLAGMPRLSLSILAAPDVNGVNGFNNGQIGGNFGVHATINITRKLSVTTGAAYAIKPYQGNFASYKFDISQWQNGNLPSNVYANCKVLDIPLNVNYQVYHRGATSWSIGTGLSSYFMLREDYRFDYTNSKSYNLQINNENRHILGVLNLNATYQHQVNSKFGLLVQPFYKLPITQIGYGKVDLRSAGVAVGVSYSIGAFRIK